MSHNLCKTPAEIEYMRTAGKLASNVLDMISAHIVPGVTTEQLNDICHNYIVEQQQAIPAPLDYHGFPKSICTSINDVACHGIPNDQPLQDGDILNIDVTVIKDGFHGDTSRMFAVGLISEQAQHLCEISRQCLELGISMVEPGRQLGDIGAAINAHAESFGYSIVREFCGHGLGRFFHEEPQVLHYGTPGTGLQLEPGMTFTIEPIVNQGDRYIRVLADEWTTVTADSGLSAQWEHSILVTDTGYEILTVS